jgi:hypothetical protein
MPDTTEATFPLEPLAHAAGVTLGQIGAHIPGEPPSGLTALADRLDTSISTLKRARTNGLTVDQADRWACRLAMNPAEVWGRAWLDSAPDVILAGAAARNAAKDRCPLGHDYDRIDAHGARRCSTCQARANRKARAATVRRIANRGVPAGARYRQLPLALGGGR